MISLRLTKRERAAPWLSVLSPLFALLVTAIVGALIFIALGKPPLQALYAYFIEPLTEMWSIHELLIKAAPLIIIAVGLSVCFRSGNWNIGAEGQFIMGAMAGSILPILYPELRGAYILPTMLLMGIIGGAAYAAIPALLKTRFNTSEILSSLMLVYVAQLFLDWTVRGPWRNPEGFNFPESRSFHPDATIPEILPALGRANWGFVLAIIIALIMWFVIARTLRGFEIDIVGESPRAARFAGFSRSRIVFVAFLTAGGLAGLAGTMEVSGAIGQLRPVISPGYGFTAIIVAFLGRLNPLGIIAAGLVLALTYLGGEAAQISIGISNKVTNVFQGILLFCVLGFDTLIHYRITWSRGLAGQTLKADS